jgi:hypothetical protein
MSVSDDYFESLLHQLGILFYGDICGDMPVQLTVSKRLPVGRKIHDLSPCRGEMA